MVFIHELGGASFSDEVEGMRACFLGGDVGQSAAAGGNAGCFKINAHSPSLAFVLAFSSPLLCSHFIRLALPQPKKAHMHNCLILLACDKPPEKARWRYFSGPRPFCTISLRRRWKRLRTFLVV